MNLMSKERLFLICTWIVVAILLWIFVPRNKVREAHVIYLFKLMITWFFGLVVVQAKLIEYPVRFFSFANRTSFTFEYVVFPSVCVLFNLYFPEGTSLSRKVAHYVVYSSFLTLIEVILEKHTNLIRYIDWTWYYTWFTLAVTFWASRKYYLWFFKKQ